MRVRVLRSKSKDVQEDIEVLIGKEFTVIRYDEEDREYMVHHNGGDYSLNENEVEVIDK